MNDARWLPLALVLATHTIACGGETEIRNALDDDDFVADPESEPFAAPVPIRDEGEEGDDGSEAKLGLTQEELDLLNDLGLGMGDDLAAFDFGLGEIVVTPDGESESIVMHAVAIQLQSDDRFWDNTLVYAWSGLDVTAGTADYLLRFRAAGITEPTVHPLDELSNSMLPTWILFGDAAADTTYYNDDGTLTIGAVTLDASTEVGCTAFIFPEEATCTTGTLEGEIDMSTLGYDGFSASYQAPDDRGVSTSALGLTATFDLPVRRASIDR